MPNAEFYAQDYQRAMTGLYGQAHVKNLGWLPTGKGVIGTVGRNLGIEAVIFNTYSISTSIQYQAHVRNVGWQTWRNGGELSGTTGKNRPIEAIKITTNGFYGVSYRVHAQDYGWLGYVSSGATRDYGYYAGTVGMAKHIEAIQFYIYQQII